jgi:hypothetical protein
MRILAAIWFICALGIVAIQPLLAHPHGPDTFDVAGTLARVDVANRIVEIDTASGPGNPSQHLLLFVDAKAFLRQGGATVTLEKLRAGRRVSGTIRRQQQPGREDRERLTLLALTVDPRR